MTFLNLDIRQWILTAIAFFILAVSIAWLLSKEEKGK